MVAIVSLSFTETQNLTTKQVIVAIKKMFLTGRNLEQDQAHMWYLEEGKIVEERDRQKDRKHASLIQIHYSYMIKWLILLKTYGCGED